MSQPANLSHFGRKHHDVKRRGAEVLEAFQTRYVLFAKSTFKATS